jgi:hypothetical protein
MATGCRGTKLPTPEGMTWAFRGSGLAERPLRLRIEATGDLWEAGAIFMLPEPYYYRDSAFLYPLQSHPSYWFYVGRSEAKQAIMGLLGKKFCVIVFSDEGDLIEVQEQPLAALPSPSRGADELDWLHGIVEREVAESRAKHGLADEAIRVKRFRLSKLQAGIDDLPDDLQEYIANRGLSSPTEEDLEEALQGWKEESLFVFWWGQSFYVDGEGAVTSS